MTSNLGNTLLEPSVNNWQLLRGSGHAWQMMWRFLIRWHVKITHAWQIFWSVISSSPTINFFASDIVWKLSASTSRHRKVKYTFLLNMFVSLQKYLHPWKTLRSAYRWQSLRIVPWHMCVCVCVWLVWPLSYCAIFNLCCFALLMHTSNRKHCICVVWFTTSLQSKRYSKNSTLAMVKRLDEKSEDKMIK